MCSQADEMIRMPSSVKARLIIIVLAATAASLAGAEDLRGPDAFSSLSDPSERARALFVEAGRVLQHPRCLNCHPAGERPTQGDDRHPHSPLVVRGSDDKGAVGRRYRRQDEAGTPYCVTIDGQTLQDDTVTIRDRDTTKQWRVAMRQVADELRTKLHPGG